VAHRSLREARVGCATAPRAHPVTVEERAIGRRRFLVGGAALGVAIAADSRALAIAGRELPVTAVEDLMREHGVLRRLLLVYEEVARRIEQGAAAPSDALPAAAALVRRFVEDYHERMEEQSIFPRLEHERRLVDLVATLRAQHRAGRALTDEIQRRSAQGVKRDRALADALRAFARMYRPHAAREDTVLFPAWKSLLTPKEYDALGDEFEERERQIVGEHGFEHAVAEVARIEAALGIDDLARFTPRSI
jgi:hemerythrin-like domain-containing protein